MYIPSALSLCWIRVCREIKAVRDKCRRAVLTSLLLVPNKKPPRGVAYMVAYLTIMAFTNFMPASSLMRSAMASRR